MRLRERRRLRFLCGGWLWLVACSASLCAEVTSGRFEPRTLVDARGPHRYQVYLPPDYSRDKAWPLVVFLHGAGERGSDGIAPTQVGLGPALKLWPKQFPCVVVFPQCESWDDRIETCWAATSEAGQLARNIVAEVEKSEAIDSQRRVLTGWSMGGVGAVQWAAEDPTRWSRVLVISGGMTSQADPAITPAMWDQSDLWLIHGALDGVVAVDRSRRLALQLHPSSTRRYDEIHDAGHEVWERVYGDSRVTRWLIEGGDIPSIDWSQPHEPLSGPPLKATTPFVTAAHMRKAVELRLGNDSLAMLSAGIPEAASPEKLHGTLDEIRQTLDIDGEKYKLRLSGLSYTARLDSALVAACSTADVRVDLGVGVELHIESAQLTTNGFEAHTGPFRIVIGHRRPTPLQLTVKPRVDAGRIRLLLSKTRFPIADDNWFVERPKQIELRGTKFTRDEIETGIVGGLYTRKSEIQDVVTSIITPLLTRVEERLNQETSSQVTQWLWPFPVYQPRVRLVAEALSVDGAGLTVSMGVELAAARPESVGARVVREVQGQAQLPTDRRHSRDLHLEFDHQLIGLVSREFAESGAARIHVLDIPEPAFAQFASLDRMRPLLPPSQRMASELRAVLNMTGPFEWKVSAETPRAHAPTRTTLEILQARLELFTRVEASAPWEPATAFDLSIRQPIDFQLATKTDQPAQLTVAWSDQPEVHATAPTGIPLEGVSLEELQRLEADLRQAWIAWSRSEGTSSLPMDDFTLGDSRLRLGALMIDPKSVRIDLFSPPARIAVTGDGPLRYRVCERNRHWGTERVLAPGESHRFLLTDAMEWQLNGEQETHVLRPGEVTTWNAGTPEGAGSRE